MSRRSRARRRARRSRSRRRRLILAAALSAAVIAAATVKLRLVTFATPPAEGCVANGVGTTYKLSFEQAAVATTVAAVAKSLGAPNHAVTVALATGLQESGLRNLSHGDRDSLGVFQQRPSQGWGTRQQITVVRYAAAAFYTSLVQLPGWDALSVNDAAQAVQRSAYPKAYGNWETEARALARDLTGEVAAGLTCRYNVNKTFVDPAAAPALARELGSVPAAKGGWVTANWLVAHARQYSVHAVSYGGYRWTAKTARWQLQGPVTSTVAYS